MVRFLPEDWNALPDLAPVYSFGPFRLDAAKSRLERNGYVVSLPPQAVHVLQVLVENHGRLVAKQELARRVWEVDAISDSNIFKQIALIRKALAPGFDSDPIQTTSGRGYRFVAPVQLSPAPQASGAPVQIGRAHV